MFTNLHLFKDVYGIHFQACERQNADIARMLLKKDKSALDIKDNKGISPKDMMAENADLQNIMREFGS